MIVALVCGFGGAGCGKGSSDKSSSARAVPSGPPQAAVTRYFHALESRDCAQLQAAATGSLAARIAKLGCAKLFEEASEHGTRLVKILSTTTSGRDPSVRLVKIQMFAAKDRFITVRVAPKNGKWALFNL